MSCFVDAGSELSLSRTEILVGLLKGVSSSCRHRALLSKSEKISSEK